MPTMDGGLPEPLPVATVILSIAGNEPSGCFTNTDKAPTKAFLKAVSCSIVSYFNRFLIGTTNKEK